MTNFTKELNTTLTTLIAQRKLWENGSYKQANAELYAILEQCGTIYAALREDKTQVKIFNAAADALGVEFSNGTSLALKIVRVVFGAKSNREYAYARVIKVGFEAKADGQTLTNFIIEQGGIENVRRAKAAAESDKLSADDYRDIAEEAFAEIGAVASFGLEDYMLSDVENETDYTVALVHCDKSGIGRIVYGSNKRSLVNTALAVMGKNVDDRQRQHDSKQVVADKKQQSAENVKQFINLARFNKQSA